MRISGLYITPTKTKTLTMGDLLVLSGSLHDERTDDILPHIIALYLNVTNWSTFYHEWLQEAPLIELLGPTAPTFT